MQPFSFSHLVNCTLILWIGGYWGGTSCFFASISAPGPEKADPLPEMGSVNSSILEARSQLSLQALSQSPWVTCQKGLLSFSASIRCSQSRADPPPAASLFHLFLCPARSPKGNCWVLTGSSALSFCHPTVWGNMYTVVVWKNVLRAPRPGERTQLFYFGSFSLFSSQKSLIPVSVLGILPWTRYSSAHPSPSRLRSFHPRGSAQGRRQVTRPREHWRVVVLTGLQTWHDTSYTFGI